MSGHPDNTKNAEHPTWNNMNDAIESKIKELATMYNIPAMRTVVNHWFVWNGTNQHGVQDFTAQAQLEKMHGIEMDINYAHYDNNSTQKQFLGPMGTNQGNYTGSGLPMKFGDVNGRTIDIYQHFNNVYDQQYMEHADSTGFFNNFKGLMDRSMHNEVYSYISVKSHNDEYFFSKKPLAKMLDYADSHGIPVWTAAKLLDFLKARNEAKFENIAWSDNSMSFNIHSDYEHTNMLSVILPYNYTGAKRVFSVTVDSATISFSVKTIKGNEYVMFSIKPGTTYHIVVNYKR